MARKFLVRLSMFCLLLLHSGGPLLAEPLQERRPHIVLIYADDVDCETVFGEYPDQRSEAIRFPNLKRLAQDGMRLSNFHATTPVCGPSRACLYSGQYAHRNQCRVNQTESIRSLGFAGGFRTFDPENELAIWMKKAGYETAHVGKYLHDDFRPIKLGKPSWKAIVPPGWDHFEVSLGSQYFEYASFSKRQNRFTKYTGSDYRTDNELNRLIEIIDSHRSGSLKDKPLLLCWSPLAVHSNGVNSRMVARRHREVSANLSPAEVDSRLNSKVRGAVAEMQNLPIPGPDQIAERIEIYRKRVSALTTFDENIGRLRSELESRGMWQDTVFMVTSDHGFQYFHQRHFGKRLPYDRVSRVPCIVAGPGIPKNSECKELLANIDIAPTLVDIASGKIPDSCDGASFRNLLLDPESSGPDRPGILIENWGEAVSLASVIPATYCSYRTPTGVYTEWATGGQEYFDLRNDPLQLHNIYGSLEDARKKQLSQQLRHLRTSDRPPLVVFPKMTHKRICGNTKPAVLSGFVESSVGTQSVELEIRCVRTGQYWDSRAWSTTRCRLPARLDQPGGVVSRWSYALGSQEYAADTNNDRTVREAKLTVVATDTQKRSTTIAGPRTFEISFSEPETEILSVGGPDPVEVSGTASDLQKVTMVRVSFRNAKSGQYWDGDKWIEKFHFFRARLRDRDSKDGVERCSWSFSANFKFKETVNVIARAFGAEGEYDHSAPIRKLVPRGPSR